jgi:hypothetical protein
VRRARIASRTKLHQEVLGGSRKAETEHSPVEGTKATPARRILWTGPVSLGSDLSTSLIDNSPTSRSTPENATPAP